MNTKTRNYINNYDEQAVIIQEVINELWLTHYNKKKYEGIKYPETGDIEWNLVNVGLGIDGLSCDILLNNGYIAQIEIRKIHWFNDSRINPIPSREYHIRLYLFINEERIDLIKGKGFTRQKTNFAKSVTKAYSILTNVLENEYK